jgi:hypothetical protein
MAVFWVKVTRTVCTLEKKKRKKEGDKMMARINTPPSTQNLRNTFFQK